MVDPNRKININLQSDEEESSSSSEEDDLNEEHVKMVKEFEEEFKDRFTEKDEEFMNFCKLKPRPPIIVYPFDNFFRHNNRGFNRNFNYQRNNHHYPHHQNRNRNNYNPNNNRRYNDHNNKRFRAE